MDTIKTGEFLAALRRSHGYTQQQVAEQLNLSNKTISKWESGGGFPDVTVLPALAELYGVTADDILAGERLHRTEEQPTAARHNYLLSRTALRFKICYVIAALLALQEALSSILGCVGFFLQDNNIHFPCLGWWGIIASLLFLIIGEILSHYGLESVAEVCAKEEVDATRMTFIRQGFSLAALNSIMLSFYLFISPVTAVLPIVLLLVIWCVLYRRYGCIFSLGCSIILLLACVCAVLYSLCHIVWWQFTIGSFLMMFSLLASGFVAIMQLLPDKSIVNLLKKENRDA